MKRYPPARGVFRRLNVGTDRALVPPGGQAHGPRWPHARVRHTRGVVPCNIGPWFLLDPKPVTNHIGATAKPPENPGPTESGGSVGGSFLTIREVNAALFWRRRLALGWTLQEHQPAMKELRVLSWNLLRLVGAKTEDLASLVEQYRPDLLLLQEATTDVMNLPALVGGHMVRQPLDGRVYGLAAWTRLPIPPPRALPLPISTMPGRVPLRVAQVLTVGGITFANVHLSHGQFLNRWQLLHLVRSLDGPAAIVGDYNAVGPIRLAGLRDVGPREPTHVAGRVIALRLDRCMVRGLACRNARVLARGSSDHHPIMVDLSIAAEAWHPDTRHGSRRHIHVPEAGLGNWLRVLAQSELQALIRRPERKSRQPVMRRGAAVPTLPGPDRHRPAGRVSEASAIAADKAG